MSARLRCDPASAMTAVRCCECGSADVVSVDPGSDPAISESSDILTSAGKAPVGWCMEHAPWLKGHQGNLFHQQKPEYEKPHVVSVVEDLRASLRTLVEHALPEGAENDTVWEKAFQALERAAEELDQCGES